MPFGAKITPVFYTVMMQFLQNEWILLLKETKYISVMNKSYVYIAGDGRIIVDSMLLFYSNIPTTSLCKVYTLFQIKVM